MLHLIQLIAGGTICFCDSFDQCLEAKGSARAPLGMNFDNILSPDSVIRKSLYEPRIDEVARFGCRSR